MHDAGGRRRRAGAATERGDVVGVGERGDLLRLGRRLLRQRHHHQQRLQRNHQLDRGHSNESIDDVVDLERDRNAERNLVDGPARLIQRRARGRHVDDVRLLRQRHRHALPGDHGVGDRDRRHRAPARAARPAPAPAARPAPAAWPAPARRQDRLRRHGRLQRRRQDRLRRRGGGRLQRQRQRLQHSVVRLGATEPDRLGGAERRHHRRWQRDAGRRDHAVGVQHRGQGHHRGGDLRQGQARAGHGDHRLEQDHHRLLGQHPDAERPRRVRRRRPTSSSAT